MKKERMTADNVEQLMEIVRALQQGEEPDPKKRKQNKRAEESETPETKEQENDGPGTGVTEEKSTAGRKKDGAGKKAAGSTSKAGQGEKESRRKVSGRLTDPDPDDEFERMLQEDDTEEEFERGKEAVAAAATRAAGLLDGLKQKRKQRQEARAKQKEQSRQEKAEREEQSRKEEAERGEQSRKEEAEREEQSRKEEAERKGQSRREEAGQEESRKDKAEQKKQFRQEETEQKKQSRQEEAGQSKQAYGEEQTHRDETQQKEQHRGEEASNTTGRLLNHMEQVLSRKLDEDGNIPEFRKTSGIRAAADASENQGYGGAGTPEVHPADVRDGSRKKPEDGTDAGKAGAKKKKASRGAVRASLQDFLDGLGQKGIHSRELVMLGAVALFVVLLVLIAVNMVRGSLDQKRRSRNVTADEGLVVTVEDEPGSWCSSYPVKLKMHVKGETITAVSVNGESYEPDETGVITVNADDWLLDAEVRTENSTKNARIEIEYLDGDAPVLEIKNEENQIILTAVDARSSVEAVYYATTKEDDYNQLPHYQKYSGAIPYEEETVYRFYSRDKAGNRSVPVVTTLETAESFSLNRTEASLFPGESFGLGMTVEPEGALLENPKYESMDEGVLSVEQNGKVTAVGNGTAAVRVTANGLDSQICTVTVSDERTVTVSAIGDCTLGTDENFNTFTSFDAFYAVNGYSYFFQNVSSILGQDDVTFANFEGTLTDSTARENKQFAFKGDPSYTEILKSGSVEVVTLANNHSRDYGEQSLTDTEQALTAAGIDYCSGDEIVIRDVNGIKTAFIGIYVLDLGMERESQVKETISRAKKQGAELIIVAFHWGSERENYPDETQTALAHTAVDCGADLVVGHHPHVLQGIEKYNGKYIVYSLANFCFGGNSAPSDMDTIIFQQTFTVSKAGAEDTDDIRIIPCKVSSAGGYNNYQPTPASGADAEQIMSRLNEYSAAYGQTYTAAELQ